MEGNAARVVTGDCVTVCPYPSAFPWFSTDQSIDISECRKMLARQAVAVVSSVLRILCTMLMNFALFLDSYTAFEGSCLVCCHPEGYAQHPLSLALECN